MAHSIKANELEISVLLEKLKTSIGAPTMCYARELSDDAGPSMRVVLASYSPSVADQMRDFDIREGVTLNLKQEIAEWAEPLLRADATASARGV